MRPVTVPVHISSLVIQCRPEALGALAETVRGLPEAELAARDPAGKAVVVLETTDESGITRIADRLGRAPGVLSASLVFHQIDDREGDPR